MAKTFGKDIWDPEPDAAGRRFEPEAVAGWAPKYRDVLSQVAKT